MWKQNSKPEEKNKWVVSIIDAVSILLQIDISWTKPNLTIDENGGRDLFCNQEIFAVV